MSVRKRFGSRKGQVLTETALILLPLMVMIFGIIDTALALWVRATMEHAARSGARYAITFRTQQGLGHEASIRNVVVQNSMGLLQNSDVHVAFFDGDHPGNEIRPPGGNAPGNVVVVTTERNWLWIAQFVMRGGNSARLRASSADRMESLGSGQNPPAR